MSTGSVAWLPTEDQIGLERIVLLIQIKATTVIIAVIKKEQRTVNF